MPWSKNSINFILFLAIFMTGLCFAGDSPKRIISLAPSISEELYDLGVEDMLVGVTTFCQYPQEARTKEKVGTVLEPSIEKIVLLSPDLVLATMEGNRPETIDKLRSLGIKVNVFNPSNNFEDTCKNFLELGRIVGKKQEAERIITEVKEKIRLISNKFKNSKPLKVFWEVGARPLVSINENSFANEFIKFSNGINICANLPTRYPRVSYEEVIKLNPDIIILVTMGDVTESEKEFWQGFSDLAAVKSKRIYIVDANIVCYPTPVKLAKGIEVVASLLHPEILQKQYEE